MKQIVSKLIVGIFNVLVPLFYIFFILAGIACAVVTTVIAYQTVKELFPKDATVWIFSIPLLVVISFEVTKVFIIFLNKQYSDSKNEKYLPNKSMFLFLRGLLIAISGIFTILFTFYNLNNPELDTRLNQQKELINSATTQQRTDVNSTYDRQITAINEDYKNKAKPLEDEMKAQENYRFADGSFMGDLYKGANQKLIDRGNEKNSALAANEAARIKALNDLSLQNTASINEAEKKLKTDNSSSNKMVNAMLEVVTFNPNYPKGYYIFAIFILSILISIGLEFVIWVSFTVLAIEHGEFFASEMKRNTLEEQVKGATKTADAMTQTEIKSMKKRFQDIGDTIINLVRRKSKDSIKKAKDDLTEIDDENKD